MCIRDRYDTAIKYYLVETKTLDGYTLDQTKHEVTFDYANDSTPVVDVTFNLTNEKPEVPETPHTVSYTHLDVYKRQPFSVRMKEAVREGQSIFSYDPKGKATELSLIHIFP